MLEPIESHQIYPVLPMRDVVLFPSMVVPLFVGRMKSMSAIEAANHDYHKKVVLVAQRGAAENDPRSEDLYQVGVLANVLQYLKLPDNTVKILVEAIERVELFQWIHEEPYLKAAVSPNHVELLTEREKEILVKLLIQQFDQYAKLNKKINQDTVMRVQNAQDAEQITYIISAHLPIKTSEKQYLLELSSLKERVERLIAIIEAEVDLLQVEQRIRSKVKKQMEKTQREYYLNEQVKAIQEELGHQQQEFELLRAQVAQSEMPPEAKDKANTEIDRLKMMPTLSAEAVVSRNYVEALLAYPWNKKTTDKYDLKLASQKLDQAHDGLENVKDRILEHLAVQKRVKKIRGPIICLVGPPGVGKTSLAASIAEAVSRKFIRIALGGVRDEAEIRGHRRTYVGAMPGKIIQKITKAGVQNPLILLDEIDKMAQDFRGDPASALLEVLDPEQNHQFNDHYLDVDVDLSDVMFLATANSYQIPPALLDRLEVINLSGYTEDEKVSIAHNHLIPKLQKNHGIKPKDLAITDEAVLGIIRHYTLEAGVRNLERELAKICRKSVKFSYAKDLEKPKMPLANVPDLEPYLGVPKYRYYHESTEARVGVVKGLAWTEVGGEQLTIECAVYPGKGKMTLTGKLGDIMQESIQAAYSVVRSRSIHWGIAASFFEEHDFHVHVPAGATPKDGPSAGITMCTALVSALMNLDVPPDIAMTGEITLRGDVLRIGGLKEKLLAARRS
ncbi:MAG: endopeptidase La, partial [Gammaproteobacteria bacterium]|nr:endopeptidase La [Gammaproteobacteria bacterium]